MHPTNCLNCATLLTADDHFCPHCGQKTDTHRLNMSHIWHDVLHAFTHADKGFFYTIKELAIRPGRVAREYVEGKRKKYFNPFNFLFIIVGVYLIANSIFMPFSEAGGRLPEGKTVEQRQLYQQIMERGEKFRTFMNKKTNIVLFVSTPFIALVMFLLFRRKGLFYGEHLVTMAYVNGFLSLLTIFIFVPLLYFTRHPGPSNPLYYVMLLTHVLYMGFMYHGFLAYTSPRAYWKTIGAGFVAILAWSVFSVGLGMLYIRYGFF